jgi:hypothetical protein
VKDSCGNFFLLRFFLATVSLVEIASNSVTSLPFRKRSKWGRWQQQYFVLLNFESRLFYFDEKPVNEVSFPRGGILLQLAEINAKPALEGEKADFFPFTIGSPLHADKPLHQLAATSEADRDGWARALQAAVQDCHHAYSEISDGPLLLIISPHTLYVCLSVCLCV